MTALAQSCFPISVFEMLTSVTPVLTQQTHYGLDRRFRQDKEFAILQAYLMLVAIQIFLDPPLHA